MVSSSTQSALDNWQAGYPRHSLLPRDFDGHSLMMGGTSLAHMRSHQRLFELNELTLSIIANQKGHQPNQEKVGSVK